MIHGHEFHLLLIGVQVLASFIFLFRGKFNSKFLTAVLFFLAVGIMASPSRFVLAHDHQAASHGTVHPCCQPLTSFGTTEFQIPKIVWVHIFDRAKEISLRPFLLKDREVIRGPPLASS